MNQLVTQPATALPMHMQQDGGKSSLMQNIDDNTSSGLASIGINGGVLYATRGTEKIQLPLETQIVIVGVAANVWRSYFYAKYDPSQEAKRPNCYSSDGLRPHPTATQPGNQPTPGLCQTCTHNAFNSAVKFKEGGAGKGKACNEKLAIAVMFYGDPTETIYRLVLPPTSVNSLQDLKKAMMAHPWQCQAPEKMVIVMNLVQKGNYNSAVYNFTPIGYVPDEMWPNVKAIVDSGNVASMLAPPEYDVDDTAPPHAHSAPPAFQAPVAQAPVAQAPVAQAPVAQAPVAQVPVPQAPVTQAPVQQQYTWPTDITGWNYPTDQAAYAQWFASLPQEGQIEFGRQVQIANSQPAVQAPVAQAPVAQAPVAQVPVPQTPVAQTPPAEQEMTPQQKAAITRKKNADLRAQGIDPATGQPIAQVTPPTPQATPPVVGGQAGTVYTPPVLPGAQAFGTQPQGTAQPPAWQPTGTPAPITANSPEQVTDVINSVLAGVGVGAGAPQLPQGTGVGLEDDEIPF